MKLIFTPKQSATPQQKALDNKLNFQKKVIPIVKPVDNKVNPRAIPNQTYA
jgi:hypothetical protein